MAYSRYRRKPRRSYRKSGPKRRSSARPSRYTARTRRYTRKRPMSKRRLVNTLSKKKRDTYVSGAGEGYNPDPSLPVNRIQPFQIRATTTFGDQRIHATLYNATHRFLVPNNYSYAASRTATSTYVIGLKESYRLVPNNESVWWHRRIVFSWKSAIGIPAIAAELGVQASDVATTVRPFRDLSGTSDANWANVTTLLYSLVFQGEVGVDWQDPMKAKLDRTRVNIHSDKFSTIRSGNDTAAPTVRNHYTSIRKTVMYDDRENGTSVIPSPFSVDSKIGIGNIYVMDLFHCPAPEDDGVTMDITSDSTYYWHER
jgi:hypothetical protein